MPELIADLPAVAILLPAASVYFLWALFHWIFNSPDEEYLDEATDEGVYTEEDSNVSESAVSESSFGAYARSTLRSHNAEAAPDHAKAIDGSRSEVVAETAPGSFTNRLQQPDAKSNSPQPDYAERDFDSKKLSALTTANRTFTEVNTGVSSNGTSNKEQPARDESTVFRQSGVTATQSKTGTSHADQSSPRKPSMTLQESNGVARSTGQSDGYRTASGNSKNALANNTHALTPSANSNDTNDSDETKSGHQVPDGQKRDNSIDNPTGDAQTNSLPGGHSAGIESSDAGGTFSTTTHNANCTDNEQTRDVAEHSGKSDTQSLNTEQRPTSLDLAAKTYSSQTQFPLTNHTNAKVQTNNQGAKSDNSAAGSATGSSGALDTRNQPHPTKDDSEVPDSAIENGAGEQSGKQSGYEEQPNQAGSGSTTTQEVKHPFGISFKQLSEAVKSDNNTDDSTDNTSASGGQSSTTGSQTTPAADLADDQRANSSNANQSIAARLMSGKAVKTLTAKTTNDADQSTTNKTTADRNSGDSEQQAGPQPDNLHKNAAITTGHTQSHLPNSVTTSAPEADRTSALSRNDSADGHKTGISKTAGDSEAPRTRTINNDQSDSETTADTTSPDASSTTAEARPATANENHIPATEGRNNLELQNRSEEHDAKDNRAITDANGINPSTGSQATPVTAKTTTLLTTVSDRQRSTDPQKVQDVADSASEVEKSNDQQNPGGSTDNAAADRPAPASLTHIRPGQKKGSSAASGERDKQSPAGQSGTRDKYRTAARRKSLSPVEEVKLQLKTVDESGWQSATQQGRRQPDAAAHEEKIRAKDAEIERLKKQLEAIEANQQSALSTDSANQDNGSYKTRFEDAMVELEGSARRITRLQAAVNNLQAAGSAANTQSNPSLAKNNNQRVSLLSKVRVMSRVQ